MKKKEEHKHFHHWNYKSLIIDVEGNSVSITEYAENMMIRYKFKI